MKASTIALLALMLVMILFGSVHSFSVFLSPLENMLSASRAEVSFFYSSALVFLTVSVLVGYRFYTWLSPAKMIGFCCLLAAVGLWIASDSDSWGGVFLGYSIIFGGVNGLGYGYALQLGGRIFVERKGLAMGAVTAAYGFGSIIFSFIFAHLLEDESVGFVFQVLVGCLITFGLFSALLLWVSGASYGEEEGDVGPVAKQGRSLLVSNAVTALVVKPRVNAYWICFFFSILSGLMIIGHAAAIVQSNGASESVGFWGAVMVGVGSTVGGFLSGYLIDRWPVSWFLKGLPVLCALALFALVLMSDVIIAITLLCLIGFAYGSIITVYPVSISKNYGPQIGPIVYGKVFTAWGVSGLFGPWFAGFVFDHFLSYDYAILLAGITALLSAIAVQYSGISNKADV
ncbi:MAG: MFS transporter [Gammaproteobacteria bacterium]|nr:MFS transporter [Gammaproteobacteria bacterium]